MPPRKKESYTKRKIFAIFIIAALLASYGTYFFVSLNSTYIQPSPASFVYEDWMWFVPAGTSQFRFMNITDLLQFEGLFINEALLSIESPTITINVSELSFGIDIIAPSSGMVAVLGVSQEAKDRVISILSQSNTTSVTINNVTLYRTSPSTGSSMSCAWMGIFNNSLIYSEGDSVALAAIHDVLFAPANNFFSNDDYKVGYIIINSQPCYVFSYYLEEANSYKVVSDMSGAYGVSSITKHEVFFITNSSDLSSTYSKIKEDLLFDAVSVSKGDDFVVATFSYPISDLRSVLSN